MDRERGAARSPDWTIDLNAPVRTPMTDSRLDDARDELRTLEEDLRAIVVATARIEQLIRDRTAGGMTRHQIAEQMQLGIETVNRVIAGGTIFGWPTGSRAGHSSSIAEPTSRQG